MGDNDFIKLGDASDLQIYHNGTHSYIDDAGTGDLRLRGNAGVYLSKYTGEAMVDALADGAVTLYHDNAAKIATASGGVTVTGEVAATSLDISGDADIDGTLEADAITVGGATLSSVIQGEATALAIALG